MEKSRRIDPEDEMSIDYYPHGRPAARSPEEILAALRAQLAEAEGHVAAGREWVGGASQSYAVASLRKAIESVQ